MKHDECNRAPRWLFLAIALLALVELLLPGSARALPVLSASVGTTFGFADNPGDSCTSSNTNLTPSFLPQAASFECSDDRGDKQEADTHASAGSVGALASVSAIPCLSSDECAGNAFGSASSTTSFIFSAPGQEVIFVTGNVAISGGSSATPSAAADFLGTETIDGVETARCMDIGGPGPDPGPICTQTRVAVLANVPVTVTITLGAGAGANAGFASNPQIGIANAFDTFSFPFGSDVFDVDAGVTVNSPDAFVFDNRYLPSDATAVPEPASGFLLVMGLIALGALRRSQTSAM